MNGRIVYKEYEVISLLEQVNTQRILPDKILVLPMNLETEILKIRVSCKCRNCGATWGVSFLQDFTLPMGWSLCRVCDSNKNVNQVTLGLKGQEHGTANS